MPPAKTLTDAVYHYLRPLIRQDAVLWQEGDGDLTFDRVYVDRPSEPLGARMRPRPGFVERLTQQLVEDRGDTLTLVTGQKGSGKTFALRKVYEAKAIEARFYTVFVRATGERDGSGKPGLPPGNADLRLLLLFLAAEVSREFKSERLREALKAHRVKPELEGTLKEWVELLSNEPLEAPGTFSDYAAKINVVVSELSWRLRTDDVRRRDLRADTRYAPSELLRLVNALVIALQETLHRVDSMLDLLLIVDDTDKFASREEVESMFLQGVSVLQQIPCRKVFTFPYWLHFDQRFNNLAPGAVREVLSNIKVVTRTSPTKLLEGALDFFRALSARVAAPSLVADESVLSAVVLASAGVPREFLRLLAQGFELAHDFGETALTGETFEDAKVILARDPIATAGTNTMRARLKYVHLTCELPSDAFWPLLDSLHVVEYVNDRPWYAVHPLLQGWVAEQILRDRELLSRKGVEAEDMDEQLKAAWLKQAEGDG